MIPTRLLAVAFACLIANPAFAANKLYIAEYGVLGSASNGVPQIAAEPALVNQTPVDFSGGAAASAAFNVGTKYIRLMCDSRCSIRISTAGTAATTSNTPLAADSAEYFGVQPGDKVSVIANP